MSTFRAARLRAAVVTIVLLVAADAGAQQNLFNVPNGDITKPGNLFFQEQFNFARKVGSSNSTFDFGLGRGWEIGFNVLDVNLYDRTPALDTLGGQQVNPDVLFNLQKGYEITGFWDVSAGAQLGVNPARDRPDIRFQEFVWGLTSLEVPNQKRFGKYYVGVYHSNVAYAGPGRRAGYMLGMEVPILPERFSFQADYISGRRDISVGVIGGVYSFKSGWQLSLGWQVPAPRSGNPHGVVVELTFPGLPFTRAAREVASAGHAG